MKKSLSFFLVLLTLFCLPLTSDAGSVLFFSPTRIDLSDQTRSSSITVTNVSDRALVYKLSMHDYIMLEDGLTQRVDKFAYSAKRIVRFIPREVKLQPQERQIVRLMVRYRGDLPDGDYHSHLRFEEIPEKSAELNALNNPEKTAAMGAYVSYSAAIPITVSHGKTHVTIDMKDVSLTQKPDSPRSYKIMMTLTRDGNSQGVAYFETYYVAPDGTRTEVTKRRTRHIYREVNQRNSDYEFTLPEGLAIEKGGQFTVTLFDKDDKTAEAINSISLPAIP